jgi:AcrR family transcriptional regulator
MAVLTETERKRRRERTLAARREVWRSAALSGATELFARDGFHATGMADIAAAAGLSLRALYEVFESKDDLYGAVVNDAFNRALPYLPEPGRTAGFLDVVAGWFEFLADNREIVLLYAHAQQSATRLSDGRDPFAEVIAPIHERIRALVEAAQAAGHAQGIDADVMAHSLLGTMTAVVVNDPDAALDQLAPQILALYAPHFS